LNFKVADVDLKCFMLQQAKKGAYQINYNHIKLQSYSLRYLISYFYPLLQSLHMQLQNTNAFGNLIRSEAAQCLWLHSSGNEIRITSSSWEHPLSTAYDLLLSIDSSFLILQLYSYMARLLSFQTIEPS
jgi:hypothetical protein